MRGAFDQADRLHAIKAAVSCDLVAVDDKDIVERQPAWLIFQDRPASWRSAR